MGIFNKKSYEEQVAKRLTEAFDAARDPAKEQVLDLGGPPLVLVSDLHKGSRNGADDFWVCERAYRTALGYYLKANYRLFVLGDAEELWEEWPSKVIEDYGDTLKLEGAFGKERYERLWGNHDDLWKDENQVEKHLGQFYGKGLQIREALILRVKSDGEELGLLFLVHGHQGTSDSDIHSGRSRIFVRYVWRNFQRLTKKSLNTPSKDPRLRRRHDYAMSGWAEARPEDLVLIAGHTHRPVFADGGQLRSVDALTAELAALEGSGAPVEEIAAVNAELELARAERKWREPPPVPASFPCYFNTGCCCFSDGHVTAIEISGNTIRLVRWLDDEDRRQPQEIAKADLREIFKQVGAKSAAPPRAGNGAAAAAASPHA
jgi:hypothetical protein